MINQAIIALGSNIGDSVETLNQALKNISCLPQTKLIQVSSFYETIPIGYTEQPNFINAVCEIETTLEPNELLQQLQHIELKHKRVRNIKNGPRTLDLDIIDFAHQTIDTENLTIPHPRAHERAFVMIPLAEILPHYIFKNNQTAEEWKNQLNQDGVQLLSI
ncbi:2-amino-4-hydroxy-6-hydroxymethyldihydropteridine diphosphokinase [Neisseriaceae bacterium PsAf]|nr:2-amino-4-hydroxy-6-hydroxymethyldihydropteridine diphosphokinase [Neisseriaceae bacterium PsAf]